MIPYNQVFPIFLTKLQRPRTGGNLLRRERLNDQLEASRTKPLTLVSAPAGFGKTTIISDWLDRVDEPIAWLSLDETDSDLRVFSRYLVAAARSVYPESCEESAVLLESDNLPPARLIGGMLCNDLMALTEPLILVLEDYHRISEPAVHDLLNQVLAHPPDPLHIVMATRRDPPLSVSAMKAHGMMGSIRAKQLRFTKSETAAVLKLETGQSIDKPVLNTIYQVTEGWPVGTQLAISALKTNTDKDSVVRGIAGRVTQIEDYLLADILERLPAGAREWLCRAALFERFCGSLCEAVLPRSSDTDAQAFDGSDFIQILLASGLPYLALGDNNKWYRFHHLVQDLLQRLLENETPPEEISGLYSRAADWFEAQGLLEEAVDYSMRAEGPGAVARLIIRQRHFIIDGEHWYSLNRWLQMLSADYFEADPELLLMQAWLEVIRGQHRKTKKIIDRIDELLGKHNLKKRTAFDHISDSLDAIRVHLIFNEARAEPVLEIAERVLARLPFERLTERGYAIMHLAGAHQMLGHARKARQIIHEAIAESHPDSVLFQGRMLAGLCFLGWIDADLSMLRQTAVRCIELGDSHRQVQSSMIGRYFMALAHYELNELVESERLLVPVIKNLRFVNERYYAQGAIILALIYQASGRPELAKQTADSVYAHMLKYSNVSGLNEAQAFQAELNLRQGRMAAASSWAQHLEAESLRPMYRHYQPIVTQIKIFIDQNSDEGYGRAADLIERVESFVEQSHNTRIQISMLVLKAKLYFQDGDQSAAQIAMRDAIILAQPSGFIRLFADMGAGIGETLRRIDIPGESQRYVGDILSVLADESPNPAQPTDAMYSSEQQKMLADLTNREFEILHMFVERLSNKEIAIKLGISASTVKRHCENVYQKLGVHGRREAVAQIEDLLDPLKKRA